MRSTIIITTIALLFSAQLHSQGRWYKKANRYFEAEAYIEAIEAYQKVVKKGDTSHIVMRNLADAYFKVSDYEKASEWYAKLWESSKDSLPADVSYRYALSLKTKENYVKSDSIMSWFAEHHLEDDTRAMKFMSNKDYRYWIDNRNDDFEVIRLLQNSEAVDFAPALMNDELVFSSDRPLRKEPYPRKHPITYLFSVVPEEESVPHFFSESLNSGFNESSIAFSLNVDTLYFTRNNNTGKKLKRGDDGFSRLKIYRAVLKGGSFEAIEELPFNSDDFSTAHPSLSSDNRMLYFASDRPGGYGGTDIYAVKILGDGKFSEPKNLGATVNTEGDESYPYINTDGVLFFASDGHPGLGGMDIFAVNLATEQMECVINLGGSINSRYDDLGIVFKEADTIGYFASDRQRETKMDIYKVENITKDFFTVKCHSDVSITTTNAATNEREASVMVYLKNNTSSILYQKETNNKGELEFPLQLKKGEYLITATKDGFAEEHQKVVLEKDNADVSIQIAMKLSKEEELAHVLALLEKLQLPDLLFSFDSAKLSKTSKEALVKLAYFMKNHKSINIKVYGHTDIIGPSTYNKTLSEKRADSVRTFLIEAGVAQNRIKAAGKGESEPKEECNKKCPHYKNRRVEYEITN